MKIGPREREDLGLRKKEKDYFNLSLREKVGTFQRNGSPCPSLFDCFSDVERRSIEKKEG